MVGAVRFRFLNKDEVPAEGTEASEVPTADAQVFPAAPLGDVLRRAAGEDVPYDENGVLCSRPYTITEEGAIAIVDPFGEHDDDNEGEELPPDGPES